MPRAYNPKAAERSIFDALLEARATYGGKKPLFEDQQRTTLSYTDLIRAAFVLGRKIADMTQKGEHVGILLPTSSGAAVVFYALHAFGRVPVILNFTAGLRNVRWALRAGKVKRILTAHRFVNEVNVVRELVEALDDDFALTWLEDVRATVGLKDKLYALAASAAPKRFRVETRPSDPGVILFTSGSYGAPKGVLLTQANLLANCDQVAAHIDLDPNWVLFNPLPVFHSFGLLGGVLLPAMSGLKAFNYPSPLHAKQIPALVKDSKASILLGTDTFLNQWARAAESDELAHLEFIVCGAERVREETHELIAKRFPGVPVIEGYGATEASPVIAINTPLDNRKGTAGGLLPGMEAKVVPIEGIPEGGSLVVKGPNIMAGYIDEHGEVETPADGWYDTGDVVTISEDNWISIQGRVKRFAKIGGEMVSLTVAEALANQAWPDNRHAVVAIPDPKKGERLVLVTDRLDAASGVMLAQSQQQGFSELTVPRRIVTMAEVPVLGTGKIDYLAVQRIAEVDAQKAA